MKTLRTIITLGALLLAVLCLSAFQTVDNNPSPDLNPLTGLPASNPDLLKLPPVIVPLARYPSAFRPSSGNSQAQWAFEMYVSDEESRPMLMYYGELPTDSVSRISSATYSLEQLRRQYGAIVIAGGTTKTVLDSGILNIEIWYGTDFSQLYPELPLADYQRILNKWVGKVTPADPNNLRYTFDVNPPEGGANADTLFVRYASTNQILWRYDAGSGKYIRFQNSVEDPKSLAADVDKSNVVQVGAENVIILMAHHEQITGFNPESGVFNVLLNYVPSDPALILRDGKLYHATWTTRSEQFERETNRMRPIRLLDENGNNFRLKPGQTWVHIVMPGNPVYEVESELGSQVTPGSGHWKMPYISLKPKAREEVEAQVPELKQMTYTLNEDYESGKR